MATKNIPSEHTNTQEEEECSLPQIINKDAGVAAEREQDKLMDDLRKGLTARDGHLESVHRTENVSEDDRVSYVSDAPSSPSTHGNMGNQGFMTQFMLDMMRQMTEMQRQARKEAEERDRQAKEQILG